MIYSEKYKVELEDIGISNKISNKRIITIMEDVAAAHSDSVGFGVKDVEKNNCAWVLLDWNVKILSRPVYNERIIASTWSRKSDGMLFAIGTSRWLYMNLTRRRPIILDGKMNEIYGTEEGKMVFDEELCKIDIESFNQDNKNVSKIIEKPYKVERRDMDINGHMHNVSYLEAAYEVLPEELYKNMEYSNIRIEYKKEIMANDVVAIKCIVNNDNSCIIIMQSENKLHAVIELSN